MHIINACILHSGNELSDGLNYTAWFGLQELKKATKPFDTAENKLQDKFSLCSI